MRIVGGTFRGRKLTPLGKGDMGAHLRPTTDRVRESLFNLLLGGRFGDPIDGASVLDVFAGSGALGFESLSRGAAGLTLVDDGRAAQKLIAANIDLLGLRDVARLIRANATRLPPLNPERDRPADLVFLDPPYGKDLGARALISARNGGWIAPDALIVWEESTEQPPPDGFQLLEHRRYGDTCVTFLRG